MPTPRPIITKLVGSGTGVVENVWSMNETDAIETTVPAGSSRLSKMSLVMFKVAYGPAGE